MQGFRAYFGSRGGWGSVKGGGLCFGGAEAYNRRKFLKVTGTELIEYEELIFFSSRIRETVALLVNYSAIDCVVNFSCHKL